MTELLTAAQMRAIEQAAIDSGEVTGLELMERAGRGVVEAIFEEWPELAKTSHKAVMLCGPGNNGGDGFVVARLLKELGWEVEVFLYGDAEKLPPDARVNYDRWGELGEVINTRDYDCGLRDHCEHPRPFPELFVDAFFGTGLNRFVPSDLTEDYLQVLSGNICGAESWYPRQGYRVVAIDVPTGLCADSGRVLSEKGTGNPFQPEQDAALTARPDLTVTFHSRKLGHVLGKGEECCGRVVCKDIGLQHVLRKKVVQAMTEPCSSRDGVTKVSAVSKPGRLWLSGSGMVNAHKYSHGHALILTGGFGKTGAARLAGRGALRVGAGLVTLGVPPSARMEVASQVMAVMQTRVSEGQELATLLQDTRLNALCLGPGLGVERARDLVPVALAANRATVLDADALTAFKDDPSALFDMLHENCVLTPHAGEFARLFPDIAEKLNAPATKGPAYSKVDATREAASRAGCVVLFKGPDTVIAAPDGACSINSAAYDRSAPWLATAGSGDVLAGFITGLLARGFAPMQAAETAAWLHVECALEFGPGLIAEDLPEQLPAVFRKLGA